jgi:hypothetical protein
LSGAVAGTHPLLLTAGTHGFALTAATVAVPVAITTVQTGSTSALGGGLEVEITGFGFGDVAASVAVIDHTRPLFNANTTSIVRSPCGQTVRANTK